MTTQLEYARRGELTKEMAMVAETEGLSTDFIMDKVAKGEIVIPCNPNRPDQIIRGIGTGLRTKVNASIGTSSDICDIDQEIAKAKAAEEEGADTLMELSAAGDMDAIPPGRPGQHQPARGQRPLVPGLQGNHQKIQKTRPSWTRNTFSTSSNSSWKTASPSWPSTAASTCTPSNA